MCYLFSCNKAQAHNLLENENGYSSKARKAILSSKVEEEILLANPSRKVQTKCHALTNSVNVLCVLICFVLLFIVSLYFFLFARLIKKYVGW